MTSEPFIFPNHSESLRRVERHQSELDERTQAQAIRIELGTRHRRRVDIGCHYGPRLRLGTAEERLTLFRSQSPVQTDPSQDPSHGASFSDWWCHPAPRRLSRTEPAVGRSPQSHAIRESAEASSNPQSARPQRFLPQRSTGSEVSPSQAATTHPATTSKARTVESRDGLD